MAWHGVDFPYVFGNNFLWEADLFGNIPLLFLNSGLVMMVRAL